MTTTTRLMTVEEFELLDDNRRSELLRGELLPMAAVGGRHGKLASRLDRIIGAFLDEHLIAECFVETGFTLARNPDTVLAPDLAVVRAERLPPEDEQISFLDLAPDLAVEVLSPSNTASDMSDKVAVYLAAGVALVWLVDPDKRLITVFAAGQPARWLRPGDELDAGDVLPGFRLRVSDLFPFGNRPNS